MMKHLDISIEINGRQTPVGRISGQDPSDAVFRYDQDYLNKGLPAISVSLPISEKPFSPEATKNFFEGLLPEGFSRKSVATWIHTSEDDYLTILSVLGSECLGALCITSDTTSQPHFAPLSLDEVKALAREGVSKSTELVTEAHLSLTGASGKVGLYYDQQANRWYKPLGSAPSTHIVKQSHVRLSDIVTNEQLSLLTAQELGLSIPESFIINTGEAREDQILFATRRFDRDIAHAADSIDGLSRPLRLHQEDFAQALGISAAAKYEQGQNRYLPEIFRIMRNYSADPLADTLRLWDILIFDFLVGNTDNHIKNLSLLYAADLRTIRLAPAYDIVSTAVYPNSSQEMAIGIAGERHLDHINRKHFENAASEAGLHPRLALKHFDTLANGFENALASATQSLMAQGFERAEKIQADILNNGGYSHI